MSDHEYQVACIQHDIRALRATLKDARDEILSMRTRLARAKKVIQAAQKWANNEDIFAETRLENELYGALAEYGEEDDA